MREGSDPGTSGRTQWNQRLLVVATQAEVSEEKSCDDAVMKAENWGDAP